MTRALLGVIVIRAVLAWIVLVVIDVPLRWGAARFWRRRIARREQQRAQWTADFMTWKRVHPDRCMYCAYTDWVNRTQGLKLKLDPHRCAEGTSAKVIA